MKVGVIDYGAGNLASVCCALEKLHVNRILVSKPQDILHVDNLILPGVGNFTECKNMLDLGGWSDAIKEAASVKKIPLLGICVGMQLLADCGVEGAVDEGQTPGLGLIEGRVEGLATLGCLEKVPHVGWNEIQATQDCSLMRGIPDGTDFYFVHSYVFLAKNEKNIFSVTDYGVKIPVVVGNNHIWGTQFHPEKSSRAGFEVLKNFLEFSNC